MPNPIPSFDHNFVLPPHLGNPANRAELSPYPCTTVDLCQRFGTTPERRTLLGKFLDFRDRLRAEGLTNGYQWLDCSFLENVESRENRPPKDIDVVTVYWGYDMPFQTRLRTNFPEVANPALAKANYYLDHYPLDAGYHPSATLEWTRY